MPAFLCTVPYLGAVPVDDLVDPGPEPVDQVADRPGDARSKVSRESRALYNSRAGTAQSSIAGCSPNSMMGIGRI